MDCPAKEYATLKVAFKIMKEALLKTKADEGRVCSEFMTCSHEACISSYSSWANADGALRSVAVLLEEEE